MKRILNIEYAAVHGTYWMLYGVVCSFASVFLLGKGYSNSDIGMILAVGNVVAVFMQPLLADFADRTKRISLIGVTEAVTVIIALLTAITFITQKASIALSIVFVLMVAWVTALQPLFNSLAFKLEESGHRVNFGAARSMGSLAYSVLCAFLGTLAQKNGIIVLPITGEIVLVMLLVTLWLTNKHFIKACSKQQADAACSLDKKIDSSDEINLVEFIKRNKLFMLVNVGIAGIFFSNAMFNNFMLQIVEGVGGGSEDMGRIFSLMAFLEIPPMFFFSRVHNRFSCQTLLKFAAICFTAKVVWVFMAKSVAMIFAAQFFQLVSFGLFLPAMVIFIDEIMEKGEAVKGQALYTIVITVSTVFASLLGGFILDMGGAYTLLLISSVVTGAGTILFIAIIDKIKKRNNKDDNRLID